MYQRKLIQLILLPFGIALLLAGLFFQLGSNNAVALQATPSPTMDRLAEPTLPASPSQADYGAQAYWLYCSPCHGDRAQGLTDEFRQQYPEEDQNCWNSHCHGKVTYENGFTIPTVVPGLAGPGSLAKFATAANLYGFIRAAMPLQNPGSLTEEEYYRIVAFLLRANGLVMAKRRSMHQMPRRSPSHLDDVAEVDRRIGSVNTVVNDGGRLTGYGGGLWRKEWLLKHERQHSR